jgi:hypothetical protein
MNIFNSVKKKYELFQMKKKLTHGGRREGAGRPAEGKERFTVTLTADNVAKAKKREANFSGLVDRLLSEWLE